MQKVRFSEWLVVFLFLLFLSAFFAISQISRLENSCTVSAAPPQKKIDIGVYGAVKKPGVFSVLPGLTMGKVLQKASPKRSANLRGYNLSMRLEESQEFHIEELSEISVYVEGAVIEPKEVVLPVDSRVCHLKGKIELAENGDKKLFRKRRYLQDGEKVFVPLEKGESKSLKK